MKKQRHYFANKGPSSQSYGFSSSHIWMWELDYKESWAQRIDAFELWWWRRLLWVPVLNIHWKDWYWSWNSSTLATGCEKLTHLKRPWFWERLKVGGEGEDRGWNGWMASLTRWRWVWASVRSWWWTGKPGVLQCMGSQKVGHNRATELNWV